MTTIDEIPECGLEVAEILVRTELAKSKSEARRLIKQKGIRIADELVTDEYARLAYAYYVWILLDRINGELVFNTFGKDVSVEFKPQTRKD